MAMAALVVETEDEPEDKTPHSLMPAPDQHVDHILAKSHNSIHGHHYNRTTSKLLLNAVCSYPGCNQELDMYIDQCSLCSAGSSTQPSNKRTWTILELNIDKLRKSITYEYLETALIICKNRYILGKIGASLNVCWASECNGDIEQIDQANFKLVERTVNRTIDIMRKIRIVHDKLHSPGVETVIDLPLYRVQDLLTNVVYRIYNNLETHMEMDRFYKRYSEVDRAKRIVLKTCTATGQDTRSSVSRKAKEKQKRQQPTVASMMEREREKESSCTGEPAGAGKMRGEAEANQDSPGMIGYDAMFRDAEEQSFTTETRATVASTTLRTTLTVWSEKRGSARLYTTDVVPHSTFRLSKQAANPERKRGNTIPAALIDKAELTNVVPESTTRDAGAFRSSRKSSRVVAIQSIKRMKCREAMERDRTVKVPCKDGSSKMGIGPPEEEATRFAVDSGMSASDSAAVTFKDKNGRCGDLRKELAASAPSIHPVAPRQDPESRTKVMGQIERNDDASETTVIGSCDGVTHSTVVRHSSQTQQNNTALQEMRCPSSVTETRETGELETPTEKLPHRPLLHKTLITMQIKSCLDLCKVALQTLLTTADLKLDDDAIMRETGLSQTCIQHFFGVVCLPISRLNESQKKYYVAVYEVLLPSWMTRCVWHNICDTDSTLEFMPILSTYIEELRKLAADQVEFRLILPAAHYAIPITFEGCLRPVDVQIVPNCLKDYYLGHIMYLINYFAEEGMKYILNDIGFYICVVFNNNWYKNQITPVRRTHELLADDSTRRDTIKLFLEFYHKRHAGIPVDKCIVS